MKGWMAPAVPIFNIEQYTAIISAIEQWNVLDWLCKLFERILWIIFIWLLKHFIWFEKGYTIFGHFIYMRLVDNLLWKSLLLFLDRKIGINHLIYRSLVSTFYLDIRMNSVFLFVTKIGGWASGGVQSVVILYVSQIANNK